jgi:hypothetical protein
MNLLLRLRRQTKYASTALRDDSEVVQVLQQLTLSWNDELIQKLQQQILHHRPPTAWSWSTNTLFLEWVFSLRHNEREARIALQSCSRFARLNGGSLEGSSVKMFLVERESSTPCERTKLSET